MRAPGFWWKPPGLAARLLQPAALAYGAAASARLRRTGAAAGRPVVCIGNMTIGGAGKTPTAIAVAGLLRELGHEPFFLTRGYGGRLAGPVLVDAARHAAADVGDEPLLLSRHAVTAVSRDRVAGAALCARSGAEVIVMDDGLQNPSLAKDLSVAVFDGAVGYGNGLPLPAGPLRAPLPAQWPLVDAVLVIGPGEAGEAILCEARARRLPALTARLEPDPAAAASLAGRRVVAFAGIGRPEKFFSTLRRLGAHLVHARPFPDHHRFTAGELGELAVMMEDGTLSLVTTEKDEARLRGAGATALPGLTVLPVRICFDTPDEVRELLARRVLGPRAERGS